MLDRIEIGNRLAEFLSKRFGSKTKAAEALGVSYHNLQAYISGRNAPHPEMLFNLGKLGCDLTWLILGVRQGESAIMDQLAMRMMALEKENEVLKRNLGNILSVAQKVEGLGLSKVAETKVKYESKKKK